MTKLKRPLYGPDHPKGPTAGRDVRDFVKRTLYRMPAALPVGEDFFPRPDAGFDLVYNRKTVAAINFIRGYEDRPQHRPFGQDDLDALWPHADDFSRWVYRRWNEPQPRPTLVEPDQGWVSLHSSLHRVFSEGRLRGMGDLGTWNPASKLPSGRPSDHAVYPAFAFDLSIEPDTGWSNLTARAYCLWAVKQPEVEYVILGNRIWTDWRKVWGAYYSGGHTNHVHVSGQR